MCANSKKKRMCQVYMGKYNHTEKLRKENYESIEKEEK